MITVGGVISGYWATGSVSEAMRPAITMMIEMTDAKIGRLMKKRDMDGALNPWPAQRPGRRRLAAGARAFARRVGATVAPGRA
jgi:hypothetical protein